MIAVADNCASKGSFAGLFIGRFASNSKHLESNPGLRVLKISKRYSWLILKVWKWYFDCLAPRSALIFWSEKLNILLTETSDRFLRYHYFDVSE